METEGIHTPETAVRIPDVVLIFGGDHCLACFILQRYPIIYGGDTIIRLVNFPKIMIGYQLPLFQVVIHYTLLWFYHPLAVWFLMALLTALGAFGLYALTLQLNGGRRAAWLAVVLYATHPFIVLYSRVPYQEPLLWAALVWGFYYLFRPPSSRNLILSSVWIAIACLTRYEGWIGAAVAASYHFWRIRDLDGKTSAQPGGSVCGDLRLGAVLLAGMEQRRSVPAAPMWWIGASSGRGSTGRTSS